MNSLQQFIQEERQSKPLILMTHVVYGYPSISESLEIMKVMLDGGVELLEVQFPFSDPVADGPVITTACHHALRHEPDLQQCILDIAALAEGYPNSRMLLMSYLNPLLQFGFEKLAIALKPTISGMIIPDLPIDHAVMLAPVKQQGIAPIWLTTPDMSQERIASVAEHGCGMLYCVSRSGVTGQSDSKIQGLSEYLKRVRRCTELPLGVGFGINSASDVAALKGHADIAIVGSAFLNAYNEAGLVGVTSKLVELRN